MLTAVRRTCGCGPLAWRHRFGFIERPGDLDFVTDMRRELRLVGETGGIPGAIVSLVDRPDVPTTAPSVLIIALV
jgi:hypothetical protein